MLVDAGADLEARDETGRTPLFRAVWLDDEPAALALLDAGADIAARDDEGTPVLVAAVRFGRKDVTRAILRQIVGDDPGEGNFGERIRASADRMAARPLGAVAGVNATDSIGRTPLHLALGEPELIELLLLAGAKPDATDENGRTPLHWAAANSLVDSARLLLEAGADPNAKDTKERTPLDVATGTRGSGVDDLLREYGAR